MTAIERQKLYVATHETFGLVVVSKGVYEKELWDNRNNPEYASKIETFMKGEDYDSKSNH